MIALEPEAAAACCMKLPFGGQRLPFAPKSKYLVFDAGGKHYAFICYSNVSSRRNEMCSFIPVTLFHLGMMQIPFY